VLYIHDRWKGENVATAEVESVIINIIGLRDAAVYGVQVNIVLNFILIILMP
jgi:acyl-coenzyme A synthetase/AMP-(fatty) acid ligase